MKTILLVEDEPFTIDVYYGQLKKDGHNVIVAKTVADALDKILNNHPDLIILDLNLRGNDIEYNPLFFSYAIIHKEDGNDTISLYINPKKVENIHEYL